MKNRLILVLLLSIVSRVAIAGIDQWTKVGPAGFGKNVVQGGNASTLYATAENDGVYQGIIGGGNVHWTRINGSGSGRLPTTLLFPRSLIYVPSASDAEGLLYLGASPGFFRGAVAIISGVQVVTWESLTITGLSGTTVQSIVFLPDAPTSTTGILYVGTEGAGIRKGVVAAGGAITWSEMNTGLPSSGISADSRNVKALYLFQSGSDKVLYAGTYYGLYKGVLDGSGNVSSWVDMNGVGASAISYVSGGVGINKQRINDIDYVAGSSPSEATFYVATQAGIQKGVMSPSGIVWSEYRGTAAPYVLSTELLARQAGTPDRLYGYSNEQAYKTDNIATPLWTLVSDIVSDTFLSAAGLDVVFPNTAYSGISPDYIGGFNISDITFGQDNATLFAAMRNRGVYKGTVTSPGVVNWVPLNNSNPGSGGLNLSDLQLNATSIKFIPGGVGGADGALYLGTLGGGILRGLLQPSGGVIWTDISTVGATGLGLPRNVWTIYPMIGLLAGQNFVAIGTSSGAWWLDLDNESVGWQRLHSACMSGFCEPATTGTLDSVAVKSLVYFEKPSAGRYELFAGTGDGVFKRSLGTGAANTWSLQGSLPFGADINVLRVANLPVLPSGNNLYLIAGLELFDPATAGLYFGNLDNPSISIWRQESGVFSGQQRNVNDLSVVRSVGSESVYFYRATNAGIFKGIYDRASLSTGLPPIRWVDIAGNQPNELYGNGRIAQTILWSPDMSVDDNFTMYVGTFANSIFHFKTTTGFIGTPVAPEGGAGSGGASGSGGSGTGGDSGSGGDVGSGGVSGGTGGSLGTGGVSGGSGGDTGLPGGGASGISGGSGSDGSGGASGGDGSAGTSGEGVTPGEGAGASSSGGCSCHVTPEMY